METCVYLFLETKLLSVIWLFPIFLQNSAKLWERNLLNDWKLFDITRFHIILDVFCIKNVLCLNSYAIFLSLFLFIWHLLFDFIWFSLLKRDWWKFVLSYYTLPESPVMSAWDVKVTQMCFGRRYLIHGGHKLINFICSLLNIKNSPQVTITHLPILAKTTQRIKSG
jgi:hypothetical protein